ncbi:FecR family protein [Dyella nitratireducens]|uniref:Transcriptional regulator n=1 Tax=Dyella nitratireducens TaxID=1849580 RepID=A0ABQ1FQQ6_9GAMM|nr:FecR domain-containing protein [Dyella nitratireducens]GGA25598.1 transcriptional regulator [Dyella nitratireducens]GLQ43664.1 transcriptional regulator [Dyella nitratireducens]
MASQPQDQTMQVAAEWWARLREPGAGDDVAEQWLAWTSEDERHLQAFEQVSALAEQLGTLDQVSRQSLAKEFVRPVSAQRRWLPLAAAASIAAVMLGGAVYIGWTQHAAGITAQVYQSGIAQNRDFTLPDGTKVALGADSTLSVKYGSGERDVEVRNGEAYFEVVHDSRRPFVVMVGDVTVRDIGTAFDVRRTGERVMVAVTQGRVAIADRHANAGQHNSLEATAGQRVSYDPDASSMTVDIVTPAQATAWRSNRLEFIDEPLGVVVANLNRYAGKPLHVADPNLNALIYTGTIRTDAIDSWIEALPQVFPLQVSREAGGVVLSDARHVQR